jgi:diaminopimelate decarboxylase
MDHFKRQSGELCADDVPLADIAGRFGTPVYVYAAATIRRHVQVLERSLADLDHLICYSAKACSNIAILELLAGEGWGFDAVSAGELARIIKAGGDPRRTILSGVGKREDEIDRALAAGVLYICVESPDELDAVASRAAALGVRAGVAVRFNPDVDARTHPHIATGLLRNKFGVPHRDVPELFARGQKSPHLAMVGLTCHIGSQVTELGAFEEAAGKLAGLATGLREAGAPLAYLSAGGGLGITYTDESPPAPEAYGKALARLLGASGLTIVLEPGRVIVGSAGVLLTRVVRKKHGGDRTFVIIDAGMNDLVRPALYGARHTIEVVAKPSETHEQVDVVGPICEASDTFASRVDLPLIAAGDLVAIRSAGAYGFVMTSHYNGRPRPAEVLVDGDRAVLIREREKIEDLWRGECRLDGTVVDALPAWS